MKKILLHTTILFFGFLFASCSLQKGLVVYEEREDEIIATEKIRSFMKYNQNPSIVLRVPITEKQATQSDPNNYIYNAIEKELVIGGFNVKDRGLFNEVVNRSESLDYSKLKELTGTELILELVRTETNVKHTTNRIYTKKGEERLSEYYPIIRPGAAIEFKLIIVDGNDYGGSYSFYYTPCTEKESSDCKCFVGYKDLPKKVYPSINMCDEVKKTAFEYIDQDIMEEFVRQGVKLIVNEIRVGKNISSGYEMKNSNKAKKASVVTGTAEDVAYYSIRLNGNVASDGGGPILERGFCYSYINQEPLYSDNNVNSGEGSGVFSTTVNNLSPKTNYFFRAYAINSIGISYGSVIELSTSNPVMYDADRNAYKIVEIGTQIWFAENLKTTKLNDGTSITLVKRNDSWGTTKNPSFCWYGNQMLYGKMYGAIYNWYAVMTGLLCPTGWHVPSAMDFNTIETYLGGVNIAGGKMKENGTHYWSSPNTDATNSSGFSGLPSGLRNENFGTFIEFGKSGFYWTTSKNGSKIILRFLNYASGSLETSSALPESGASVRCIKDN